MRQYEMFELSFQGREPEYSMVAVDVRAEFICDGEKTVVDGFYAGNGIYKVRFYPKRAGHYQWIVSGVITGSGEEICEVQIKKQGMVKTDGFHFRYENGKNYYPFGTTVYAMVHQPKEHVDITMRTLAGAPFNKIRFCVFPKDYDFSKNEPELFVFEKTEGNAMPKWDVHHPCFEFWNELERRINQLDDLGIEGDLILFHPYDRWGFSKLTKDECLVYLDYAMKRLSAYPNLWWSLANEFDLMGNFEENWWAEFARFIHEHDPYGHLLSNHNCLSYWDFANPHTTHCSIQDTNLRDVGKLQKTYGKPVVYDECCYEGNIIYSWGNISAFEMTHRFWVAVTGGGYCTHGETYMSENNVLWWAMGGVLHGNSPTRIGFLRKILEELPGPLTSMLSSWESQLVAAKDNEIAAANQNFFTKKLLALPEERIQDIIEKNRTYQAKYEEKAYLYYYGKQCTSIAELELPEDKSYRVEVIDIWEMRREEVLYGTHGKVKVKLPGKEGIAVLVKEI